VQSELRPFFAEGPFGTDISLLGKNWLKQSLTTTATADAKLIEQLTDQGRRRQGADFCGRCRKRATLLVVSGGAILIRKDGSLTERCGPACDLRRRPRDGRVDPEAWQTDCRVGKEAIASNAGTDRNWPSFFPKRLGRDLRDSLGRYQKGKCAGLLATPKEALDHVAPDPQRRAVPSLQASAVRTATLFY